MTSTPDQRKVIDETMSLVARLNNVLDDASRANLTPKVTVGIDEHRTGDHPKIRVEFWERKT